MNTNKCKRTPESSPQEPTGKRPCSTDLDWSMRSSSPQPSTSGQLRGAEAAKQQNKCKRVQESSPQEPTGKRPCSTDPDWSMRSYSPQPSTSGSHPYPVHPPQSSSHQPSTSGQLRGAEAAKQQNKCKRVQESSPQEPTGKRPCSTDPDWSMRSYSPQPSTSGSHPYPVHPPQSSSPQPSASGQLRGAEAAKQQVNSDKSSRSFSLLPSASQSEEENEEYEPEYHGSNLEDLSLRLVYGISVRLFELSETMEEEGWWNYMHVPFTREM